MKSKKQSTVVKVLSLAIIMIFTLSFVMGFVGSSANVYAADGDTVTRAEWLSMLAKTFEMTVEEEDYPDNYFSDLDETSEYYKDILLNVEFGVVDVEAGDPVYPDQPATREFAARTLNYCLAFKLEEETEYTFSDTAQVKYPLDAQVAINRNWFQLIDGAFSPETPITKAESDAMMADALEVWHSTDYEEGHVDQVEFKEGITDLTKESTYLLEDGSLVLINGSGKVNVGDKIALDVNGIPCVILVETTEVNGNDVILDGTYLDNEDAYADVDVQGTADGSSIIFGDPGEGVDVEYEEVEQPSTRALRKISGTYNLNENRSISLSKEFTLGEGAKLKFKAKLKNSKIEYALRLKKESYIKFSTDTDFTASCAVDLAEATGMNEFPVLPATIPGVGGFDIIMEFSLGGELSAKASGNLVVGVAFDPKDKDFRMIKSFKAKDYSMEIEASASAGLKARLGVTGSLLPLKGFVYADVGVIGTIKTSKYSSGTPIVCTTFASYLYANAGCEISYTIGFKKYKYKDEYEMYNEDNSPLRIYHHYEDKKEVPRCTRGDEGGSGGSSGGDHNFKYFTPVTSKHWSSGWGSGSGSKGYTRAAEPVIIWEYELDEKYNAKLTSYKGNATALTIPSKIDGYTVTGIGNNLFKGNTMLTYVGMPDTIETVGEYAFNNCTNLRTVKFSDALTEIGYRAFMGCTSLEDIDLPDGLVTIKGYAFNGCTSLRKLDIPDSVTDIEYNVFQNCSRVKEIKLSNKLVHIGAKAFSGTAITSIEIPKSLDAANYNGSAYSSNGSFTDCSELKTVTFEEGTTKVARFLLAGCNSLESIVIPDTITTIDEHAFYECLNLREVKFSSALTSIENRAFMGCTSLEELNLPDGLVTIKGYAFNGCTSLKKLNIPDSVTDIEYNVFQNCTGITEIKLSKKLEHIGAKTFSGTAITSIEIPKSLDITNYNGSAYSSNGIFTDCSELKTVTFEEGTTKVARFLLAGCNSLESIVIPDTVTTIDEHAFFECLNLKDVKFSSATTTIAYRAFMGCTSLEEIDLPDGLVNIKGYAFHGCTALKKADIPDSVTDIDYNAFQNCSSMTDLKLSAGLKEIEASTFNGCTSLVNITWNDSLEIINERAFENCDSLLEALIPGNVSKIGNYAFNDCDKLEKVTVPDSVTNFGTNVFYSCDKLKDVTLGSGITTIPNYTFYECGSLEEIVIPYRVTKIGAYAFANDPKLTKVTIPRAVTTIENTAFSYPTRMTIYGISGTYAETFANEKGCTFVNQEINATSVKLSQAELKLNRGASATLIMTVEPANFTDLVSWKSSDTNIVTVSDTGVVTGKSVGTATIKLVVGSVSASCKVTVVQPVTSISLNRTSLSMEALDTFQLTASVNPSNAEDKTVSWESSDPAVATVDETGLVTALTKGTATITVKAMDGSDISRTCNVTVTNTAHVCTTVDELESPHNYPDNCNDFWVYTQEGMTKLIVTFDEKTNIEDGFDYLYIYDSQGNEIGKYTGTALAGKTIEVPGDTIKIKIVSDDSGNEWGFKVKAISSDCDHKNIVVDPAVPATCTEPGLTEGSHCADCGAVIVAQTEVPALGHDWGEWTVVKAPTQDEEGLEERVCKNDPSHVEQRTIPKLDHNHEMVKTEGVEATCVDDGSIEYWTCSICHKMYSDEEGKNEITEDDIIIPAPGHDFEEIVTPATLTKNGSIVTKCTRCGKVKSTKKIYYPETFELSETEYVFDGKVKKPAVSIIDANGDEIKATYYDVKYASGRKNVGKYTVTITMKGNYTGTEKLTFKINPKGTTLKSLTKGSKAITVKWTKQSTKMASTRITGYQIQLATNSKFTKGKKSVTVSGYSKVSKKVTGLKAKKTYYVRIRTYKTVSGTKYYSKWSAKKSVKTN